MEKNLLEVININFKCQGIQLIKCAKKTYFKEYKNVLRESLKWRDVSCV